MNDFLKLNALKKSEIAPVVNLHAYARRQLIMVDNNLALKITDDCCDCGGDCGGEPDCPCDDMNCCSY